jgi:anti-sigma-K factor RskA
MIDEESNDLAVQYALGVLPRKQVHDFESQLRVDSDLQELVSDLQELNEMDARESPIVAPPIDGYSRILEQIAPVAVHPKLTRSNIVPFLGWAGWGLAACFAAAFFVVRSGSPSSEVTVAESSVGSSSIIVSELTNARAQLTSTGTTTSNPPLASGGVELRVLELANLAEAFWSSRLDQDSGGGARTMLADAKLRSRENTENQSEGFTVFDRELKVGVIAVDALPEIQPNRSYHIWARRGTDEPPVWAGSIPVGEANSGLFFFDLTNSDPGLIRAQSLSFFVTQESSSTPDRPEGRVVLTGL